MRIAIAEIGQETDTFSPLPTTLELFKSHGLFHGDEILERVKGVGMLGGFLEVSNKQPEQIELLPIIRAWAGAGGWITNETLDYFENHLVLGLQDALPLDVFSSLFTAQPRLTRMTISKATSWRSFDV